MYRYKITNDTQGLIIISKKAYITEEKAKIEAKNKISVYCTSHIEGFTINDKIKVKTFKIGVMV